MSQQIVTIPLNINGYTSVTAYAQDNNPYVASGGTFPAMITIGSVGSTTSEVSFSVEDNQTNATRTCFIHLFGNLNTSSTPDATITVQQSENDILSLEVTNVDISNYQGSPNYFTALNSTASSVNNGGTIHNSGVTNYGARFTTNQNDTFQDLDSGLTASGAQLFSIDFLNESQQVVSTDDNPASGTSGWLSFTAPSSTAATNQQVLQWSAAVNPQNAPKRFARLKFRHPVDSSFEDTVLIEQDRGYDPSLDEVDIRCEETPAGTNTTDNPQTITSGNPTVGTLSGSFASQTSGASTYSGDTFVLDNNSQVLTVQYDVEKSNVNFNTAPLVTLDMFDHEYDYTYLSPQLGDFATVSSFSTPTTTLADYNFFNTLNIESNNTIATRRFRLKAHHPDNTNYPSGSDGYMYVIQKPQPLSWFPQNGNPTALSDYVDDPSFAPTSTTNYLSASNVSYNNSSGAEYINYYGTSLQGIAVRATGNKAPLVLVIKYGEYNTLPGSTWYNNPGPGFPSQSDIPGSTSSLYPNISGLNGYEWEGLGYPNANDLNNWPIGNFCDGTIAGEVGYPGDGGYNTKVEYLDTNTNNYVDYKDYVLLNNQLNGNHVCQLKLTHTAPVYKERFFGLAVWHPDNVDYSTIIGNNTHRPKPGFEYTPDDILWVANQGNSITGGNSITVALNQNMTNSTTSNLNNVPTNTINIAAGGSSFTSKIIIGTEQYDAFLQYFYVQGADYRVKFRCAYQTDPNAAIAASDFRPLALSTAIQNSTNIDAAGNNMTGSGIGSDAVFGNASVQATAIGSQSATFENEFGVNPQHFLQGSGVYDSTIENEPASGQNAPSVVGVRIPENNTGEQRQLQVIFESEWDSQEKVIMLIKQSA